MGNHLRLNKDFNQIEKELLSFRASLGYKELSNNISYSTELMRALLTLIG